MGMAMGHSMMPNVPIGVPPPGMLVPPGGHLMHQQMIAGGPFNANRKS